MIETYEISAGLARELALLDEVVHDPSRHQVLFWQADQGLVAPQTLGRKPGFAEAAQSLEAVGWPVHLRKTGGDVTPQGPGIVNVALVYGRAAVDVDATYDTLCRPMEQVLGAKASRGWNAGAFCDGAYNVQWDGLKFAGTAQRFRRCRGSTQTAVLSHALMLFQVPSDAAIQAINRFLEALGEPRVILKDRHTGLPPHWQEQSFVEALRDAYLQALSP